MSFTIGSLFDGSGGFPLAAAMCGGTPVWASEVEPYPIAVTKSRFPNMKHLGSVTDVKGDEVEPVDVITFGSPCQDLSVAGKRAGLKHEDNGDEETTRSGLFMEAVRIIKEMRKATNGLYPRFAVWENVPGAFSSNKGEDFRTVCEELIKIVEPGAVMPPVPKNGWPYADVYCGEGWSLAYRVYDAQYWGVPQRRRRIYLVVDFAGERAGKISFEREGLRGYFTESRTQGQATAADAEGCTGADDREGERTACIPINTMLATRHKQLGRGTGLGIGKDGDPQFTLSTEHCHAVVYAIDQQGGKGRANYAENVMPTLCSDSHGTPHAVAYGVTTKGNGDAFIAEERHASLSTGGGMPGQGYPCTMVLDDQGGQQITVRTDGKSPTLRAEMHGNVPCVLEAMGFDRYNQCSTGEVCETLRTPGGGDNYPVVCYGTPAVFDGSAVTSPINASNPQPGDPCHTLSTDNRNWVVIPACCEPVPIHDQATRFSGKRGDKADGKGNGLGVGNPGDPMNTLTSGDRHAVAFAMQAFGKYTETDIASAMKARDFKDATDLICEPVCVADDITPKIDCDGRTYSIRARDYKNPMAVCYGVDCRNMNETPELYPTLQAKSNGGQSLNYSGAVRIRYIVRRLTPTECARLQGFADRWAVPVSKEDFADEEYAFWLNVRNTHAEINGKATKEYTKEQMLSWYNKLHTDSSEYKLWGNGIALPTALYVMQGISDVINQ